MNLNIKQKIIAGLIVIIGILGGSYTSSKLGGLNEANSYKTVSTFTASTEKDLLKLGGGILRSVTITGAGSGTFELYDASTTNSALRTITATSSLRKLASFPTNAAAGTYQFNGVFSQGLIVVFTGTQGTTTIAFE